MRVQESNEMNFAEKLKELRELTGIGNAELAKITGINPGTIKSYFKDRGQEGAREPSFSNAARIAKAFGKDLNYFLDCDEVEEPIKKPAPAKATKPKKRK